MQLQNSSCDDDDKKKSKRSVQADLYCYNIMIRLCARSGMHSLAMYYFNQINNNTNNNMIKPDRYTINAITSSILTNKKSNNHNDLLYALDMSLSLLDKKMYDDDTCTTKEVADSVTFNNIIILLGRLNRSADEILYYFEKAVNSCSNKRVDRRIYNAAIYALGTITTNNISDNAGDNTQYNNIDSNYALEKAIMLFRRLKREYFSNNNGSRFTDTYNSLLVGFARAGKANEALLLLSEMNSKGNNIADKRSYTSVIIACGRAGEWQKAVQVFRQMSGNCEDGSDNHQNSDEYGNNPQRNPQRNDAVQKDKYVYGAILKALCRNNDKDDSNWEKLQIAEQIFSEFSNSNIYNNNNSRNTKNKNNMKGILQSMICLCEAYCNNNENSIEGRQSKMEVAKKAIEYFRILRGNPDDSQHDDDSNQNISNIVPDYDTYLLLVSLCNQFPMESELRHIMYCMQKDGHSEQIITETISKLQLRGVDKDIKNRDRNNRDLELSPQTELESRLSPKQDNAYLSNSTEVNRKEGKMNADMLYLASIIVNKARDVLEDNNDNITNGNKNNNNSSGENILLSTAKLAYQSGKSTAQIIQNNNHSFVIDSLLSSARRSVPYSQGQAVRRLIMENKKKKINNNDKIDNAIDQNTQENIVLLPRPLMDTRNTGESNNNKKIQNQND